MRERHDAHNRAGESQPPAGSPPRASRTSSRTRILLIGLAAEAGIGLVGLGLALAFGVDIGARLGVRGGALLAGVAATVPPVVLFFYAARSSWPPLARIREKLRASVLPHFATLRVRELVVLAVLAGVGEELLFRGFLQQALVGPLTPALAIALASVVFGLVHWITPFYALYAAVLGAYLGVLFHLTASLAAAAICHAGYDAVALVVYRRMWLSGALGDGVLRRATVDEDRANGGAG